MSVDVLVPFVVCVLALILASAFDWRSLRIYNWLTLPLCVSGVMYHGFVAGAEGATSSLFAGAVAFGAMTMLYLLGAMGAGDVKLVTALGCWLGVSLVLVLLSIGLLVSAATSMVLLSWQGRVADSWLTLKLTLCRISMIAHHMSRDDHYENVHDLAQTPQGRQRLIPFSIMLTIAILVLFSLSFLADGWHPNWK